MKSKNRRVRIHEIAYEGPLAMPSSPLVTQNIPLAMHRDAQNSILGLML